MTAPEKSIKLVLIGNTEVGKTSILTRYFDGKFKENITSTLGIEFKTTNIINNNGCNLKMQIWDTSGQAKFDSITQNYFREADGLIFVFDITNRESFEKIPKYMEMSKINHKKFKKILIGNKIDLEHERIINNEDIDALKKKYNIKEYFEASAVNGNNIDTIFKEIANLFNGEDDETSYESKESEEENNDKKLKEKLLPEVPTTDNTKGKSTCGSCCCF